MNFEPLTDAEKTRLEEFRAMIRRGEAGLITTWAVEEAQLLMLRDWVTRRKPAIVAARKSAA